MQQLMRQAAEMQAQMQQSQAERAAVARGWRCVIHTGRRTKPRQFVAANDDRTISDRDRMAAAGGIDPAQVRKLVTDLIHIDHAFVMVSQYVQPLCIGV